MSRRLSLLSGNIKHFKRLTLWPRENESFAMTCLRDFLLVSSILPLSFGIWIETVRELRGLRDDIHSLLITSLTSVCVIAELSFIFIIYYKRKHIMDLPQKLKQLEEFSVPPTIDETELRARIYVRNINVYMFAADFFYILLPLLDMKNCTEKKKVSVHLQHIPCGVFCPVWCPFAYDYSPVYELMILYMLYFGYTYCFVCVGWFMLNCCVVMHIIEHLRNLKILLKAALQNSKEGEELFKKCVKYHKAIIEISALVDNCFSPLSFTVACVAPFIFGILELQILIEESYFESFRYVIHLLGWVFVLFLLTYTAQRLWDESVDVANEIYCLNWIDLPIAMQREALFMLMRAQKPITLSTGPIGSVNLETYLAILRSAYSYFALLANLRQHQSVHET